MGPGVLVCAQRGRDRILQQNSAAKQGRSPPPAPRPAPPRELFLFLKLLEENLRRLVAVISSFHAHCPQVPAKICFFVKLRDC